jgi:hypothetical protein
MTLVLVAGLLLAQPYVRTRVNERDATSQCIWWPEKTGVVWNQNVDGSSTVAGSAEFTAIERAFAPWEARLRECGNFTLTQGARTASRKAEFNQDGANENVVLFRTKRCADVVPRTSQCVAQATCANEFDCWEHSAAALGVTTTTYNAVTGSLADADIELNDTRSATNRGFLFTVVDAPPCLAGGEAATCVATDVQNTVTHEVGHFMGLAHSAAADSTMLADAQPGETSKRSLDTGSLAFVCQVYPQSKGSRACVLKVPDPVIGTRAGCSMAGAETFALAVILLRRRKS